VASGSGDPLTPERVADAEFKSAFRGLDPIEVRAFLQRVGDELRAADARVAELRAEVERLADRPPPLIADLPTPELAAQLGRETARVVEAARDAADEIRRNAETAAAAMLAEAEATAAELRATVEAEVTELRTATEAELDAARATAGEESSALLARAETLLEERTAEAEAAAATLRDESEQASAAMRAEAETLRDDARAKANGLLEQATAEAEATLEQARQEGRQMVAEARAVRERILGDMAARRDHARRQLERARAARERLVAAIEDVDAHVRRAKDELHGSLAAAKLAGDRAALAVQPDDEALLVADDDAVGAPRETAGDLGGATEDTADAIDTVTEAVVAADDPVPTPVVVVADRPVSPTPIASDATSRRSAPVFGRARLPEPVAVGEVAGRDGDAEEPVADVEADVDVEVEVDPTRLEELTAAGQLGPVVRDLTRALKRALADQENALLDSARRGDAPVLDDLDRPIRDAAAAELVVAARLGASVVSDAGADRVDAETVAGVADEVAAELAGAVLERLDRPAEGGDDPDVLDARIRGLFRELRNRRVGALAEQAAQRAWAAGELAAVTD